MSWRGEWLILAERVIQDSATGGLTVVSCLSRLAASDFPTLHSGFAVAARYCREGAASIEAESLTFRLLREEDGAAAEEVLRTSASARPGAQDLHIHVNFRFLRLKAPGGLRFRLQLQTAEGSWEEGPTSQLWVERLELSQEQRASLRAEAKRLGLGGP
jgi:hypothetical protein